MLHAVTLLGSSSGRNAGDAALISGIMESVDRACGAPLIYEVPTIKPGFIRRAYSERVRPVGMLPWNLSIKMLGLPTYRSVMRTDLTLIFDAILFDRALWNPLFNFLSTLNLILPAARRRGKRMAFYNVGAGPVRTDRGKRMLRHVAEQMDFITVRDEESMEILHGIGVRHPRALLTADAALGVAPAESGRADEILRGLGIDPESGFLAFNINRYLDTWAGVDRRPVRRDEFLDACARAINTLAREEAMSIVFITTQHNDVGITKDLMARIDRSVTNVLVTNREYGHAELKAILGRAGLLFAMRLHATILASAMETPILGLAYQPKVHYYFNQLGLGDHCLSFDAFSADALLQHLRRGWREREAIRETIRAKLPPLLQRSRKAADLVAALHREDDLDAAFARASSG